MGAVEAGLQILIGPRPGKLHHTGAEFESSRETVFASVERQEIQAERLLSLLADGGGPLLNLIWSQVMTSQSAKAARSRNGGHERRRGGGAHAAERDRVLDVQQVTDWRSDHEFLHYESLPRVCCPAGLLVRANLQRPVSAIPTDCAMTY